MTTTQPIADLAAVKRRQQSAWSSGDYAVIRSADETGQAGLTRDLTELMARFNRGGSGTLVVPGEYLEVVATRR